MKQKKGWVMINAFHPAEYEKEVYFVDFWKKGTVNTDISVKRFWIEARSKSEAIKKAWNMI